MGVEENKAVVRQYYERTNNGDESVIDELMSGDFVFHATSSRKDIDKEDFKKGPLVAAFPDQQRSIEMMIAEDNLVSVYSVLSGTHEGQLGNTGPTGKSISVPSFAVYRLENGKIAEAWNLNDHFSLLQQIGALPSPEEIEQ